MSGRRECPGVEDVLNDSLGSIAQTTRQCGESTTPVLVASSSGASTAQNDRPNIPPVAIVIPIVLSAIALLMLVGIVYSRFRDAISITPVLCKLNEPEKPKMWEVHIASVDGGNVGFRPGQRESASARTWPWCELTPVSVQAYPESGRRTPSPGSAPSPGCRRRPPWPFHHDPKKEPFVDGGMSSSASYAGFSGEEFRCLRVAVLVVLPAPSRTTQRTTEQPDPTPSLCFGLVDTK